MLGWGGGGGGGDSSQSLMRAWVHASQKNFESLDSLRALLRHLEGHFKADLDPLLGYCL